MPNVTANLKGIDQDLSAVVYLSSSSTVLLLLPTSRIYTITTGHDLAFAAHPVGVDVLHSARAVGHQPSWGQRKPSLLTAAHAPAPLVSSAHVSVEVCAAC